MWFGRLRVLIPASEMTSLVCADLSRGSTTLHTHPSRNIQLSAVQPSFTVWSHSHQSHWNHSRFILLKCDQSLVKSCLSFCLPQIPLLGTAAGLGSYRNAIAPQSWLPLVTQKDSGKAKALKFLCTISRSRITLSSVTHLALVAAHCPCLQALGDPEGMIFPARLWCTDLSIKQAFGGGQGVNKPGERLKILERRRCSVCSAIPPSLLRSKDAFCFRDRATAWLTHPPQTLLFNFSPWKNIAQQGCI